MNDFWSRRLGTAPANTSTGASTYHPQLPSAPTWTPAPTPLVAPGNPKAPSSMSNKSCPECGSGNYTGVSGDSTKMIRCYDCGYNPRFGQQAGAAGLPSSKSNPAQAARQVSTENNYHPEIVIGHVNG